MSDKFLLTNTVYMTKFLKMWEEKPEAVIMIILAIASISVSVFFGYNTMR
ncbi:hypothetical protein ACFX5D_14215 [Flavobacterium sp. LB3P45]|uniref:Uncharacterized protein n=1 Tax=Flavobacterium fructosi TaxID=3230416 RepID=A0ABW6HQ04_9FLAO